MQIDSHFMSVLMAIIGGLITVILALIGYSVKGLHGKIDEINTNVAENRKQISIHDRLIIKIETNLENHLATSSRIQSQIDEMTSSIQSLVNNCIRVHTSQVKLSGKSD